MKFSPRSILTSLIIIAHLVLNPEISAARPLQAQIIPSSISEEINHTTVSAIFKDRTGILWIGTQYGLYRFDGNESRFFNANSSGNNWIPASDIRAITENAEGETIVATFGGGVLKFDKQANLFRSFNLPLSESNLFVKAIYYSESGSLWIGSEDGLLVIESNDLYRGMELLESLAEIDAPTAITGNGSGLVFIASENSGVWVVDEHRGSAANLDAVTGLELTSNALAYGPSDMLYIGTKNGHIVTLSVAEKAHIQVEDTTLLNVSPPISSMTIHGNFVWIGTNNGLYSINLDTKNISHYESRNSRLSNDHITFLLEDEDSIWIGTYQGLSKLKLSSFRTYDSKRGGISEDVMAFEEDYLGNLWVGTYNGLYVFDRGKLEKRRATLVPTKDAKIMTVAEKSGEMWIGFRRAGVEIIDLKNFDSVEHKVSEHTTLAVTKIIHDCDDRTWISTYGDGLYLSKGSKVISLLNEKLFEEKFVTILATLANCSMLVGTEKSIYLYESEDVGFRRLNLIFDTSNESRMILSLREDKEGNIWIGTKDSGIFMLPKNLKYSDPIQLIKMHNLGHIANASIYGIEQDQFDNIWLSTQHGLIKLKNDGGFVQKFDYSDGLQGNDFNFGASFVDSKNNIYFGGVRGFTTFGGNENIKRQRVPSILLTGILLNNSGDLVSLDMPAYKKILLNHRNHFITFKFSILDFIDPEKNIFRHKLENYDPDWIDIGTRNSATYTKLPPGDYVLHVEGANSAGVWTRDGLSIGVTVLPPPWLTWWAYVGYAVFLLFVVWLIIRTQHSFALKRGKKQLESEMLENEERAYEELHEQFALQDNFAKLTHEHSRNTLTTIGEILASQQEYIADNAPSDSFGKSCQIVNTLQTLENCTYFSSDELTVDFHQFTQLRLDELLESVPISREKVVTINEVTRGRLTAQAATPLAIFINEALENSLLHAFDSEQPAHYLQISLQCEPEKANPFITIYTLDIADNGVGIPGNIVPTKIETLGFTIMQAMAKRLSGRLAFLESDGTRIKLTFSVREAD